MTAAAIGGLILQEGMCRCVKEEGVLRALIFHSYVDWPCGPEPKVPLLGPP